MQHRQPDAAQRDARSRTGTPRGTTRRTGRGQISPAREAEGQPDPADEQGTRLEPVEPSPAARRRGSRGRASRSWRAPPSSWSRSSAGRSAAVGVLAELQGPDVGRDRPSVARRDPRGVGVHHPVAVGDHLEEVPERLASQPFARERRRRGEPALDDHALAVAELAVARRAEDPVPLLTALEDRRDRPGTGAFAASRPRSSPVSSTAMSPRLRAASRRSSCGTVPGDQRPRRRAVVEEGAGLERLVPRLVVHVAAAADKARATRREPAQRRRSHGRRRHHHLGAGS